MYIAVVHMHSGSASFFASSLTSQASRQTGKFWIPFTSMMARARVKPTHTPLRAPEVVMVCTIHTHTHTPLLGKAAGKEKRDLEPKPEPGEVRELSPAELGLLYVCSWTGQQTCLATSPDDPFLFVSFLDTPHPCQAVLAGFPHHVQLESDRMDRLVLTRIPLSFWW